MAVFWDESLRPYVSSCLSIEITGRLNTPGTLEVLQILSKLPVPLTQPQLHITEG